MLHLLGASGLGHGGRQPRVEVPSHLLGDSLCSSYRPLYLRRAINRQTKARAGGAHIHALVYSKPGEARLVPPQAAEGLTRIYELVLVLNLVRDPVRADGDLNPPPLHSHSWR